MSVFLYITSWCRNKKKGNTLLELPPVGECHSCVVKEDSSVLQKRNFIIIHAKHMFVTFSLLLFRIFCVILNTKFDQLRWGRSISIDGELYTHTLISCGVASKMRWNVISVQFSKSTKLQSHFH